MSSSNPSTTLTSALDAMFQHLLSQSTTPHEDVELIRAGARLKHFKKGELLYRAGDLTAPLYYIVTGLTRLYYQTVDGRDVNKSFRQQTSFCGVLPREAPARYSIQAVEPVTAIELSITNLERLCDESLFWASLERHYLQQLLIRKQRREASFLLDNAEQRYLAFLAEEPDIAARLPLYHIASYLGITDVALSRIRRRLNR